MSLAQRYWNFEWDEDRNRAAYGPFASIEGVGANLRVRIASADERDLQPGLVLTKRWLDHRALFADEPCFGRAPSTLEAIAHWLRGRLDDELREFRDVSVFDGPFVRCRARADAADLEYAERLGNLTLVRRVRFDAATGLGVTRGDARRAWARVATRFARVFDGSRAAWGRALFAEFQNELPHLVAICIDHGANGVQRVDAE